MASDRLMHFDFKDLQTRAPPGSLEGVGTIRTTWIATAVKTADRFAPLTLRHETHPRTHRRRCRSTRKKSSSTRFPWARSCASSSSGHTTTLIVPATNYRRWLNYSWHAVEPEGQPKAGDWTPADDARLKALVDGAHKLGYWIRFYTLDGYARLPTIRAGSSNIISDRKPRSRSAGKPLSTPVSI